MRIGKCASIKHQKEESIEVEFKGMLQLARNVKWFRDRFAFEVGGLLLDSCRAESTQFSKHILVFPSEALGS
jgi:hypothetical protein